MKLSELIAKATALMAEHGDLDLFDADGYQICGFSERLGSEFPRDWNMPDTVIQIDSAK